MVVKISDGLVWILKKRNQTYFQFFEHTQSVFHLCIEYMYDINGLYLKVERQMMMQNIMREQQMSIQLARSRDLFHWWAAFYVVAAAGAVVG